MTPQEKRNKLKEFLREMSDKQLALENADPEINVKIDVPKCDKCATKSADKIRIVSGPMDQRIVRYLLYTQTIMLLLLIFKR
ncbi:MAG: hypothetical protein EOL95_09825 [Bacteroidia bacterium]|nr:hypothetical protein [Bacteroidia bacterium]